MIPTIFDFYLIRETTLKVLRSDEFKRYYDLNKLTEDEVTEIANNISEYFDIPNDDDWTDFMDLVRDIISDETAREEI